MIHKLTKNVHCNKSYIKNIIFANKRYELWMQNEF